MKKNAYICGAESTLLRHNISIHIHAYMALPLFASTDVVVSVLQNSRGNASFCIYSLTF